MSSSDLDEVRDPQVEIRFTNSNVVFQNLGPIRRVVTEDPLGVQFWYTALLEVPASGAGLPDFPGAVDACMARFPICLAETIASMKRSLGLRPDAISKAHAGNNSVGAWPRSLREILVWRRSAQVFGVFGDHTLTTS